jgi:hypothetical protein
MQYLSLSYSLVQEQSKEKLGGGGNTLPVKKIGGRKSTSENLKKMLSNYTQSWNALEGDE